MPDNLQEFYFLEAWTPKSKKFLKIWGASWLEFLQKVDKYLEKSTKRPEFYLYLFDSLPNRSQIWDDNNIFYDESTDTHISVTKRKGFQCTKDELQNMYMNNFFGENPYWVLYATNPIKRSPDLHFNVYRTEQDKVFYNALFFQDTGTFLDTLPDKWTSLILLEI